MQHAPRFFHESVPYLSRHCAHTNTLPACLGPLLNRLKDQKKTLVDRFPAIEHEFKTFWVTSWQTSLEFLPIRAFRQTVLSSAHDLSQPQWVFRSSGSTQAQRAFHGVSHGSLRRAQAASTVFFLNYLADFLILNPVVLSLIPRLSEAPHSSLAAMVQGFSENGCSVCYVNHYEDLQEQVNANQGKFGACVVLGTALHHLKLWTERPKHRGPITSSHPLVIIDTGGTKGRTFEVSRSVLDKKLCDMYRSDADNGIHFLTEYGMCELLSQAYGTVGKQTLGEGVQKEAVLLTAAPDLIPFLYPLTTYQGQEVGYLGFIDAQNTDSYGAILTEDLAILNAHRQNSFYFLGRAPDASLKGCSLNIRGHFEDWSSELSALGKAEDRMDEVAQPAPEPREAIGAQSGLLLPSHSVTQTEPVSVHERLARLDWEPFRALCSASEWIDFSQSLSLEKPLNKQWICEIHKAPLTGTRGAVIAAANTPMSAFYPVVTLLLLGTQEVVVSLPLFKTEDPLAARMRVLTECWMKVLQDAFGKNRIRASHRNDPLLMEGNWDHIVVFGTDETLGLIKSKFKERTKGFYGFGSKKNSLYLDGNSTSVTHAIAACAQWYGRGCLSPVAVFSDFRCSQSRKRVAEFVAGFQAEFSNRIKEFPNLKLYAHHHDCWGILARARTESVTLGYFNHAVAKIFDMRSWGLESLPFAHDVMGICGGGVLGLLDINLRKYLCELTDENPFPKLSDVHEGKTWLEWFTQSS